MQRLRPREIMRRQIFIGIITEYSMSQAWVHCQIQGQQSQRQAPPLEAAYVVLVDTRWGRLPWLPWLRRPHCNTFAARLRQAAQPCLPIRPPTARSEIQLPNYQQNISVLNIHHRQMHASLCPFRTSPSVSRARRPATLDCGVAISGTQGPPRANLAVWKGG